MQYEIVFKSDRNVHVMVAAQTTVKMVAAPGTGTPPKDLRLLTIATPKQVQHIHIHANKTKTKKQYNIT